MSASAVIPPNEYSPHASAPTHADRIAAALAQVGAPVNETSVIVGPHCAVAGDRVLDGMYVVALDGSIGDEGLIPVVAAWTVEFGGTPWLVDVVDRWWWRAPDVIDSAYVNHRAMRLRRRIGLAVEHETLHGDHPARAIVEFACDAAASLIFVCTDSDDRRGRRRRRLLASQIVRRATCPVVLLRPPLVPRPPKPACKPTPPAMPPVWSRAWCEQYGPDAVRLRQARPGTRPTSRR